MISVKARCVSGPNEPFGSMQVLRRDPGPGDVLIDLAYTGICHSDIEHVNSVRGHTMYPIVPGHEMVGIVSRVGEAVTRFKVGDRVGVGNMVQSCRKCENCMEGLEQYCTGGRVLTYNAIDQSGQITYGGYSQKIVVDEHFVLRIPDGLSLRETAPLLCAGITMYSSLIHWRAAKGTRVAILGLGGLGHVGVQMSRALGAHTTVLERSEKKRGDAMRLGADDFHISDDETVKTLSDRFDLILSTVPISVDLGPYMAMLRRDGTYVNLAVPNTPLNIPATTLLANRRSLSGSRSGGLAQTQEMLDFCALHGIASQVEVIHADNIDDAYRRLMIGDVRFRFVIDNTTI